MKFRAIPQSDVILSEIGFGFQGVLKQAFPPDTVLVARLVCQAYDKGITYFDAGAGEQTAVTEETLREALSKNQRANIVIGTGVNASLLHGPHALEEACEASLKRLDADVIDVFNLNDPVLDGSQAARVAKAFERLIQAGKIRAAGVVVNHDGFLPAESKWALGQLPVSFLQMNFRIFEPPGTYRLGRGALLDGDLIETGLEHARFLWDDGLRTAGQVFAQYALSKPWVTTCLPRIETSDDLDALAQVPSMEPLSAKEIEAMEQPAAIA